MNRENVVRLASAVIVVVVSSSIQPTAQSDQSATANTGVLAGRVIDAVTGQPVAGARLNLNQVNPSAAVRAAMRDPRVPSPGLRATNELGQFRYDAVEPGRFRLWVTAPGYVSSSLAAQASWEGFASSTEHQLAPGEQLTDLVIRMWPSGSVSGTVRDGHGEPIVKATVQLLRRVELFGQPSWQTAFSRDETDDRGMYDLGARTLNVVGAPTLPGPGAGEYLVVVRPGPPAAGVSAFEGPLFAPGVRFASAAQVISLGDAEHRAGVDIVVPSGPSPGRFAVSGRLVSGGTLRTPVRVHLVPRDALGEMATIESFAANADASGRFTFTQIPAGEYRLQAWQFPEVSPQAFQVLQGGSARIPGGYGRSLVPLPAGPTWVADLPLTIEGQVNDLAVPMRAGARIRGRVRFEGDRRPPQGEELTAIPVAIYPWARDLGPIPMARVEPDGRFVSPGLPPEQYRLDVRVRALDRPLDPVVWWPSSITVNGRPVVPGRLIDLGTEDLDVDTTYTDRRAELTGTVRDTTGRFRPDARVILFTRDPDALQGCLSIEAVDRAGVFRSSTSMQMGCLAAAVLNPPERWRAPEYLESLVPFAVPFRLELGQTRTVNLTVRP